MFGPKQPEIPLTISQAIREEISPATVPESQAGLSSSTPAVAPEGRAWSPTNSYAARHRWLPSVRHEGD